jgi:NADPH:quinone reductase-like Zn-dependent oxidoreductase
VKAITFSRTGDSSVLQLRDREVPEPDAGQVRVRIVGSAHDAVQGGVTGKVLIRVSE